MANAVALFAPEPETEDGQVSEDALKQELRNMFKAARDELELMGRLAVGQAKEGEDYNWLPSQAGFGGEPLVNDNPSMFRVRSKYGTQLANNSEQFKASSRTARCC